MWWRYPVLLGFGALLVFGIIMVIGSTWTQRRDRKTIRAAVDEAREKRNNIWKEADSIRDMVNLYTTMVAKHGPDSEEARAFRFGTDSSLMKKLHGDSEAMKAFEQQADIVDETYYRMRA